MASIPASTHARRSNAGLKARAFGFEISGAVPVVACEVNELVFMKNSEESRTIVPNNETALTRHGFPCSFLILGGRGVMLLDKSE